jgi:hypothetical protein
MVASILNAAVIYNNAGPYGGTSFDYNWHAIWGQSFSPGSVNLNYVEFDLAVIKHGNPLTPATYAIMVTVTDQTAGVTYDTQYPGGTATSTHVSTTVGVPSGHTYNITVRVSNGQSSSFTDYWGARVTNIVISN